jgi:hypothetical protein
VIVVGQGFGVAFVVSSTHGQWSGGRAMNPESVIVGGGKCGTGFGPVGE